MSHPSSTRAHGPHPIPTGNDARSFSAISSPSAVILRYIFTNTSAQDLYISMRKAANNITPDVADRFLECLKATGIATPQVVDAALDPTRRHCKQCHREYIESQNGPGVCSFGHCQPEIRLLLPNEGTSSSLPPGGQGQLHGTEVMLAKDLETSVIRGQSFTPLLAAPGLKIVVQEEYKCCGAKILVGIDRPLHGLCFIGRHTTRGGNARFRTCEEVMCQAARSIHPAVEAPASMDVDTNHAGA
ncbi:hypothetical protein Hypma_003515 [Hypsizygus marmoreus]|uniref:Uncharacterized protein n=1 Tax=Hypsizygus marmoreus TaxID=39966 RepID=A0A369J950_HYPMA|nr:hypothetical protein Hypma_003515 [Hypsizygus marmoreus]